MKRQGNYRAEYDTEEEIGGPTLLGRSVYAHVYIYTSIYVCVHTQICHTKVHNL